MLRPTTIFGPIPPISPISPGICKASERPPSATFLRRRGRGSGWRGWRGDRWGSCRCCRSRDPVCGREKGAEIPRIFLLPEARGQGIGRMLLAPAIETARARGAAYVWLDTVQARTGRSAPIANGAPRRSAGHAFPSPFSRIWPIRSSSASTCADRIRAATKVQPRPCASLRRQGPRTAGGRGGRRGRPAPAGCHGCPARRCGRRPSRRCGRRLGWWRGGGR